MRFCVPAQWFADWSLCRLDLRLRSVGYFKPGVGIESVKSVLAGVVTASALLHFYYDGFIWKVREKSTRQSLGITGGTADVSAKGFLPRLGVHGAKWVGVFVIPLGALWLGQTHLAVPDVQRTAWVVADVPDGAKPHFDYGSALQNEGKLDEAIEEYKIALQFDPNYAGSAHESWGCPKRASEVRRGPAAHGNSVAASNPTTATFI